MKFDFKSALMGACLVFGLLGLNSFRAPMRECLTQEQTDILNLMSIVTTDDCNSGNYQTLRITGANLQVVNGLGSTDTTNGTGNIFVGYFDNHCGGGSHNVIIGDGHVVSSYAGLAVGQTNTISAPCSVAIGYGNLVSGPGSSVLSGSNNNNEGVSSCIVSGADNHIYDELTYSAIVGGYNNEITSNGGVICGGQYNVVSGSTACVSGGNTRTASGADDWVAGSLFEDN